MCVNFLLGKKYNRKILISLCLLRAIRAKSQCKDKKTYPLQILDSNYCAAFICIFLNFKIIKFILFVGVGGRMELFHK